MADYLKDVNHIHTLPDFVEGGIDYLPGDFLKEKKNLVKFLTIYLERLKAIDEMLVKLSEGRLLRNAAGLNLDEIGNQVGIERNGLDDATYRVIIMILAAGSARHGTRPEFIETLDQLFGVGNFTTYKGDNYRFDVNVSKSCFDLAAAIDEILDLLPLPTHLRLTESVGLAFGFKNDKHALGFGSVAEKSRTGDGGLAHLVYVPDPPRTSDDILIYVDNISVDATE